MNAKNRLPVADSECSETEFLVSDQRLAHLYAGAVASPVSGRVAERFVWRGFRWSGFRRVCGEASGLQDRLDCIPLHDRRDHPHPA